MTDADLIDFIRNRVTLELRTDEVAYAYDTGIRVKVVLLVDGEPLLEASDSFHLPSQDNS